MLVLTRSPFSIIQFSVLMYFYLSFTIEIECNNTADMHCISFLYQGQETLCTRASRDIQELISLRAELGLLNARLFHCTEDATLLCPYQEPADVLNLSKSSLPPENSTILPKITSRFCCQAPRNHKLTLCVIYSAGEVSHSRRQ